MKKRGTSLVLSFVLFAVVEEVLGLLIPDKALTVAFGVVVTAILIGLPLVVYGTFAKNRWGVNFDQINCPRCQLPVPKTRKPKSWREMLWGGAICDQCGCPIDKWGNSITT
jgi:hypothetical protein